jgi:hypothetical protein
MNKLRLVAVAHGPSAEMAILGAFISRRGEAEIVVEFGVRHSDPVEMLVLVAVNDARAVFRPSELQDLGERIIRRLPDAPAYGAPPAAIASLRHFATALIEVAKDAAAMSPHGMH